MNVAYFSNQFASTSGHGIAHYSRHLHDRLRSEFPDINIVPVATGCDRRSEERTALKEKTGLRILPLGRKIIPLAWTFLNGPPIENMLAETIDITHIVSLGFPVATRKKLVVTVHDIGPLTHPEYFSDDRPWLFKRSFNHMVRHADEIICVSQATADEVCQYAGNYISTRIHIIHEGVDIDYFSKEPVVLSTKKHGMPPRDAPFCLTAGAISPRKNIKRVLEAFTRIKDKIPHHFVLAGGTGWEASDIEQMINSTELVGRVHHLGYVTDDQLHALYKGADFYIHASLFEGFGLTVLEAMASGCPVITSNTSSLPEVTGEAALLVDPCSVDSIADAIQRLALSQTLCEVYTKAGYERASKFRWSRTAEQVANVYRKLV